MSDTTPETAAAFQPGDFPVDEARRIKVAVIGAGHAGACINLVHSLMANDD
jgi:hypothetical protein